MAKRKGTKLAEWQKTIKEGKGKCAVCGAMKHLTVDHIIPVSVIEDLYADFGIERDDLLYNDEKNFQILCNYCNIMKGNRIDIRNPKTIQLLKSIMQHIELGDGYPIGE